MPVLEKEPPARQFLCEFHDFLRRYGHRETVIIGPSQATWSDAPAVVLGLLKGFAAGELRRESPRASCENVRDTVLKGLWLRFFPLRSVFVMFLAEARCFLQIREDAHFDVTLVLPILRKTALELGRRLVNMRVLDSREDVFHLKLGELGTPGVLKEGPSERCVTELHGLVDKRKRLRAELGNKPVIDPRIFRQPTKDSNALLHGVPSSPGEAQGVARVICEPSE